eukprot:scaffold123950_cov63-Phaeocystis_antarctica.AAC.3
MAWRAPSTPLGCRARAAKFEGDEGAGRFVIATHEHSRYVTYVLYMVSARMRHQHAISAYSALIAGASHSSAARSKCAAAFLSSAAERGPASQASLCPRSTTARMTCVSPSFGAALATLADSALSASSFHHSGLATSPHSFCRSSSKAFAVD